MKCAFVLLVLAFTSSVAADDSEFERLLVPISIRTPIPGAHSSMWNSVLLARNASPLPVTINNVFVDCRGVSLCPNSGEVPPGKTVAVDPTGGLDGRPGAVLLVHRSRVEDLHFSLRINELSRQSSTWGTQIPVVRERDFRTRVITLLGAPNSPHFRTTLRIYDLDRIESAAVRVRLFGIDRDKLAMYPGSPPWVDDLLGDKTFLLSRPSSSRSPGYLEIGDLSGIAGSHNFDLIAIEIAPVTPGLRLWAFVAVIHNESQHLTVITPQ